VKETYTYKLQYTYEEFIHVAHIEILKVVEKFQPGRRNFKSYVIMCLMTHFKKIIRDAEAMKRIANLRAEDVDGLEPKMQDKIFQSPVNVEKYVIDKITLEERLKPLSEVERKALYLSAMGYTQYEIAEMFGFKKTYGNVLLTRARNKMKNVGA
jgi:RNA polymerase sigma factor (sigma-70 family)